VSKSSQPQPQNCITSPRRAAESGKAGGGRIGLVVARVSKAWSRGDVEGPQGGGSWKRGSWRAAPADGGAEVGRGNQSQPLKLRACGVGGGR
jgi:hypothetical protein